MAPMAGGSALKRARVHQHGPPGTLRAVSATSSVPQPSDLANARASVSLPNRKSTYGMASSSVCLNGGTCVRMPFGVHDEVHHSVIITLETEPCMR